MFAVFVLSLCAVPAFADDFAIVVTAERREQDLRDLPANAASLGGRDLQRVEPQVASEALNRLPGVAIHRNNGVENLPAVRSPVLNGGQSAGSFLVLEDGVPIRAPGFANVNQVYETSLDFAERVELTRGPGSALYGSNAVHGIINVLTPPPGAREHRSSLEVSAGQFGRFGAVGTTTFGTREGAVDDPVVGFVGLALDHDGGWRAQSGVDTQQVLAGIDAYVGGWALETRLAAQNLNQETASFIQGTDAYKDSALSRTNPTPEAFRDQQLVRARATLSRDFGDWRLALTPYGRTIESELLLSFFPSKALEESEQTGGGLQAAAYLNTSDTLSFILGFDGDWTDGSLRETQSLPTQAGGYVQGLHYDYDVAMRTLALYAQARWRFAEDWSLTAGVRGESVRYDYDNHAPDNDVGRFRRPADRTDEFDAVTPKLGVVWNVAESQSLWLNLARGARAPQITDLYSLQTLQTPGAQDVETIDSVELGWRGTLGPAALEVALYHMDKEDTSFRNADGFTVADGATRHQGIEIAASAPVGDKLELSGWLSYAHHTYRFNDPVARAGESISSGDDVDSAPRWLANGRALWHATDALDLELEWVHMGRYFTNADNSRTYPGHDVFNLRAELEATENVAFFAAVRNVTNTDYAERADFAFGNDRYFPGEDRGVMFGVRATR